MKATAGLTAAAVLPGSLSGAEAATPDEPIVPAEPVVLSEYGFFDYLAPGYGGIERFELVHYQELFEDMAAAGMNSINIGARAMTTGWRSKLPFLDQIDATDERRCAEDRHPFPNIDSDNDLLRSVIAEAHKRKIKVWLTVPAQLYPVKLFGGKPLRVVNSHGDKKLDCPVGFYHTDDPLVLERAPQMFAELVELLAGIDGMVIEVEDSDWEAPERIALYDAWAKENNRRAFDQLGHPLMAGGMDVPEWRDYTTYSKSRLFKAIQDAVRAKGFRGEFATFCELGRGARYFLSQTTNIELYRRLCPGWSVITYQYEKWMHRYSYMDFCVARPKLDGVRTFYLPRGVMTWGWPLPIALEESWRMDVEDIALFRPDGVWWFGCGALNDGVGTSRTLLQTAGYADGNAAARRALLQSASRLRAAV